MAIEPLFSTRNYVEKQTELQKNTNQLSHESNHTHEFFLSTDYKNVVELIPSIVDSTSYHLVSFGQFSLKHVVFHIITLIGACEIFSTTYGLGPNSARGIVNAKKQGIITDFHFLYDHKIKTYKEEAHYLCESNFEVKITSIHAKITAMINDNWGVTISGSANWSDTNRKIETIDIIVDRKLALFHSNWIQQAIRAKATEPSEIIKQIQIANG